MKTTSETIQRLEELSRRMEHLADKAEMKAELYKNHQSILSDLREMAVLVKVSNEIKKIMSTYREQKQRGYVDSPGGLEHMGDVWGLLESWDKSLIENLASGEEP